MNSAIEQRASSSAAMRLLERGWLPDWLIRLNIRRLLAQRLREEDRGDAQRQQQHLMDFVRTLRASPIALSTAAANEQHYEVPTEFFVHVLGRHMKYSSCYFDSPLESLESAEERMLALTCERARVQDGERILELGCGWGSLSLWMAQRLPRAHITAVSNSRTQKSYIDACAAQRGLRNLSVLTCDINQLRFDGPRFDRVVSVEMFEHMRNYEELLQRVSQWMAPAATLFVHIFTHLRYAYPFEVRDESDWLAKYFFTGGIMPSDELLLYFQRDVRILDHWQLSGKHYQRTSEAWLARMDAHRASLMPILDKAYGKGQSGRWWIYWRVFFMACAELWGYREGREWIVSHYLFEKR